MQYKIFFFLIVFFAFQPGCFSSRDSVSLKYAGDFPKWLDDGKICTDQTSGIVFIGLNADNKKIFLLADDIGAVYHMEIDADSRLTLERVDLSASVKEYLKDFPKKDFEDITYDPATKKVYVSIEGNGNNFKKFVGIYEFGFKNNDPFSNSIESIKKLSISPDSLFTAKTARNLGFEGIAVDKDYFYFGLEGDRENVIVSEKAYIYIVDKKDLSIRKILNTKTIGVETICGLYAVGNKTLVGVDRNNRNFFYIKLNDSLDIFENGVSKIQTSIPGYLQYDYISAIESVTMDDENNIYMIDDPWKSHYVPADFILEKLDAKTQNSFKRFVPIIYKVKMNNKP